MRARTCSFALLALVFAAPPLAAEDSVRVVVHPAVKGNRIPRDVLASIFLVQVMRWGDGTTVLPVDQSLKSNVRSTFSKRMLRRSYLEIQVYWQRRIASGQTPPPVRTSDQEVLAFVAANVGAIGYVSATAELPANVKALDVSD